MAATPSYRTLAEQSLRSVATELRSIPQGSVPTDVMAAHAAQAQAIATVAVAQALLHLGDLLTAQASGGEQ